MNLWMCFVKYPNIIGLNIRGHSIFPIYNVITYFRHNKFRSFKIIVWKKELMRTKKTYLSFCENVCTYSKKNKYAPKNELLCSQIWVNVHFCDLGARTFFLIQLHYNSRGFCYYLIKIFNLKKKPYWIYWWAFFSNQLFY